MINLQFLMDDAKCFATVRDMRWPSGVMCPHCHSPEITKQGRDDTLLCEIEPQSSVDPEAPSQESNMNDLPLFGLPVLSWRAERRH